MRASVRAHKDPAARPGGGGPPASSFSPRPPPQKNPPPPTPPPPKGGLNVVKKTGLVLVDGEVNVPGYVNFRKGDSLKKYINKAGGFSAFAETRDVLIIYPNGIAKPYSRWFSPKVQEGSTIIVNQRNISGSSRGPTGWEAFSIISSEAASVATTLLLSLIHI